MYWDHVTVRVENISFIIKTATELMLRQLVK